MTYRYDHRFYEYITSGSLRSAEVIIPIVLRHLSIRSVVDFGCGSGAWLSVWKRSGVMDILGLDGDYLTRDALLIAKEEFRSVDLSASVRLERAFDLVQSLEVAEHLPSASAAYFVDSLVTHGPLVLFSAATPGQGGENHLNEQSYEYWRALFRDRGYVPFDPVRPRILHESLVEPWYRYNILLYVHTSRLTGLVDGIARTRIADNVSIPDLSPLSYRLRKALLRRLPTRALTLAAIMKRSAVLKTRA